MNLEKNAYMLLKEKVTAFLYPLKMGGEIKSKEFMELLAIAEEITEIFKNDDFLPKNILLEIYLTSIGISSENEFHKRDELSEMANKLMNCFNLLLSGKSIRDEVHDEPRVV